MVGPMTTTGGRWDSRPVDELEEELEPPDSCKNAYLRGCWLDVDGEDDDEGVDDGNPAEAETTKWHAFNDSNSKIESNRL